VLISLNRRHELSKDTDEDRQDPVEEPIHRKAGAEACSTDEVEEIFDNAPHFDFVAKGHVVGENVYWALGQTDAGRYLTVFFIYKTSGTAMPISARDMNRKERKRYEKK